MADDKPPPEDLDSTQTFEQESGPPQRIGNYRILQKLGEGGMGIVYLAEQEKPIRRRVALKIIKLGMDTKAVIARFEAERQALAIMDHSNVAKVFDAGATEQGRPYFVMEYVKGVPITVHCDRQRLTTTERLRLFMHACEGVQHAHQKGIIHRDLKPSNVLVAIEGDKAVPKIIDFGVAKATEHRLTEQTVFTQLGQIIGTPEYMSPEQAEMTTQDIDTRTDVYSLGVILYELLVGALPFDSKELRKSGFDEIRRKIREEEPSRPSTRVTTLDESSKESANRRRTDPAALAKRLRGDLDWITMKALEKDRTRRYSACSELATDIGRHLNSEPVLASPPSATYRLGKYLRRHKLGVFTSAAIVIALVAGLAGVTFGLVRTVEQQRLVLEQERLMGEISVLAIGASRSWLEAGTVALGKGDLDGAARSFAQAENAARRALQNRPDHPWLHLALADSLVAQARLDKENEAIVQAAAEQVRIGLESIDPSEGDAFDIYVTALNNACDFLITVGDLDSALENCSKVTELLPDSPIGFYNLAGVLALLGRTDEALDALRRDSELGDTDWQYLANDPWFETLRGDDHFDAIIREMRGLGREYQPQSPVP